MKVYLLNPPFMPHFGRSARWQDTGRGGTLYYPIWLAYATASVERDFESRLVDAPAWGWSQKEVVNDVLRYRPDLIIVDSSFPSLSNDVKVAEVIKQNWDAKTVMVGPPTSLMPNEILKSSGVDIVARLEYDLTVREIANAVENKGDITQIKGISYKTNGHVTSNPDREFTTSKDLDAIPFVSKVYQKHLHIRDYFLGSSLYPEVQIFTGRGCPSLCTFCSWPQTLMGRKYRVRSIDNVLDELEWVQDNLKINEVFFEDDTFTLSRKRVEEFTSGYRQRGLNITWACNARASLDYELMKEMKKANCRLLIVGYESGNNSILETIKKGINVDQSRQFAKNAQKAGLLVHGDFIIGLPGETKETIKTTEKLIKEVKPDILQVSVATPFPGTEFFEWSRKNGYLLTDNPDEFLDSKGHQKAIIGYPWLSAEEITAEVDKILKEYYLSLGYVRLAFKQVFRKNGLKEFRRLFFSFKMFLRYIRER
jgi:anaerobic magnesium-protoporphyrin IX monomethyl ester cyclase